MDLVPVHMPKYGMTMEEGIIVEWLVKEGDRIKQGDGIAIIETEKVATELEAPASGIIVEISADIDQEVPVGNVIAYIERG